MHYTLFCIYSLLCVLPTDWRTPLPYCETPTFYSKLSSEGNSFGIFSMSTPTKARSGTQLFHTTLETSQ